MQRFHFLYFYESPASADNKNFNKAPLTEENIIMIGAKLTMNISGWDKFNPCIKVELLYKSV